MADGQGGMSEEMGIQNSLGCFFCPPHPALPVHALPTAKFCCVQNHGEQRGRCHLGEIPRIVFCALDSELTGGAMLESISFSSLTFQVEKLSDLPHTGSPSILEAYLGQ